MGIKENNVTKRLNAAVSDIGGRLFRINSGTAWIGNKVEKGPGWVKIYNPRPFRNPIPKGFPDTFGFTPVEITEDMVGKKIPVFTLVEAKTSDGVVSDDQKKQIRIATNFGVIAGVARNPEQLIDLITNYTRELTNARQDPSTPGPDG